MLLKRIVLLSAVLAAACSLLVGCAGPAASVKGTGLYLAYTMQQGQPLKYRMVSSLEQTTEVRGDTVRTTSEQRSAITLTPLGQEAGLSRVSIAIDSMRVAIGTPAGDIVPDVSGVIGKSFEMSVSQLGQESGFPDQEAIQYDLGPQGKRSATAGFQMMFPNTAGRILNVGDAWTTKDSFDEGSEGQKVGIEIESTHVLEGFETVAGLECVRIRATYTGTITGSGSQGPVEWSTDGTVEGTSTWYFAYKEGILVSDRTEGIGESTVVVKRPDGETAEVPTTSTTLMETILVR